jgi:hypothetical protein
MAYKTNERALNITPWHLILAFSFRHQLKLADFQRQGKLELVVQGLALSLNQEHKHDTGI